MTEITLKVLPKKKISNTIVIDVDKDKIVYDIFDKVSESSSEISGAIYIPNEPEDININKNKDDVFKFNDLAIKNSFLALRLEGDKISVGEKIKAITKEIELNKFKSVILESHQSEFFWKKVNNLELFSETKNNLIRLVIEPASGIEMMKCLGNNFKYYIDWCGALFWIDVPSKKNNKVKEIKDLAIKLGGYLTVIKPSQEYDYEETIFTIDKTRLIISEKIKESFDPKRVFNPGKMYRGI